MLTRLLVLSVIAILCVADCVQVEQHLYGRLVVLAYDPTGHLMEGVGVDLIEAGSRKSHKSAFHGNVAEKVPYGDYIARVSVRGFFTAERTIRVYQPETSLRVELQLGGECLNLYHAVYGSVRGTGNRQLWIKAIPLRGSGGAESPIDQYGNFSIAGLDGGSYFLAVVDGGSIIYTQTTKVFEGTVVAIDLGR